MKRGFEFSFFALILAVILPLYFVLAASGNLASSTAGNGTTVSMLWFNVSNASTDGNMLTSVTINQTGNAAAGTITNITVSNNASSVYYNASCCTFPVIINIGRNITENTNFTVNFTISSSATDAATIIASVTTLVNETNVSYTALPYTSSTATIDSLKPYVEFGSGTTSSANLSQSFIFVNISANDTVSNLHSIVIYRYNSTNFNSSINSSLSSTRAIHTINFTSLSDGTYYINATTNDTYNLVNSTSTRTITLDTVAPTVSLPNYTNGSSKKNTASLTLNISITDATSGLGNGLCIVNVNGTNQSISISNGWCNSTSVSLTGLSDGNKTINVYVNDSANNVKLNNSFVVQVDTTAPSASPSCTPLTVYTGDIVTCTCSGSDSTSGVATSSASSTPSTSSTGTFSYGCTVTDNAGNSASASTSYTVEQLGGSGGGGGGGGGGSSITNFWTKGTYSITEEQFSQGHSMEILAKQRVKVKVSNEDHYVGIKELIGTTAKIEVSSAPQEKILSVGEEWKTEITGDNYYDLSVKLTSIANNKAIIFVKSIYELIPQETPEEQTPEQEAEESPQITGEATEGEVKEGRNLSWLWILLGLIVVILIVWLLMHSKKRH